MMFQIDRRTASDWVEQLHAANADFIAQHREGMMVEVAQFASSLTFNFLKTLRELGEDPITAAHISEHACHGISFAVVQHLLVADVPDKHPKEKVN